MKNNTTTANYQTYSQNGSIRLVSITGQSARGYWFDSKAGIKQEDQPRGKDYGFFILANVKGGKLVGFVEMFEAVGCGVKVVNAVGKVDFIKTDSIYPLIKNKSAIKS